MPSHAVRRLLALQPTADPTMVDVTVELECGCQLARTVPEDRVVQRPGGERFVVGKIPCPSGHPVRGGGHSSSTPIGS